MRSYELKSDDRKFVPRSGAGKPPASGLVEPDDDPIPMFREIGAEMSWSEMDGARPTGRARSGIVRAIRNNVTLIECPNGEWFEESPRGIHQLHDHQRCTGCGSYLCSCHPTHHQPIDMTPTPLKDLASLEDKFPITCVVGKITKLYDAKSGGEGDRAWTRIDAELSDGTAELKTSFWMDSIPACVHKGNEIRISCGKDKKGKPAGLSMSVRESGDKTYRSISVDDRAKIELATETASAASEPSGTTQTPQNRQNAPASSSVQSGGHQGVQPVFDDALADYKRAFCKVCESFGHDPAKIMVELTAEKLAEITTSVSMASTRGEYGRYIGYRFAGDSAPTTTGGNSSWKTFLHPKSGKALGEYDDAAFLPLAQWAYHPPKPITQEWQPLAMNVRMATAEKGLARSVFMALFAGHKGYGQEFDENDLETVCQEQLLKSTNGMTTHEWGEWLDKFDAVIQDCETARSNVASDVPS